MPYPEPGDAAATTRGKANPRAGTKPEVSLRQELHARGLRFRKDHLLRFEQVRVRPDVVFTRARVAVFVDGCFWHRCPQHGTMPSRNRDYWLPKLEANVARDRRSDAALVSAGWHVERAWEHEPVGEVADRVEAIVRSRLQDQVRRS